MRHTTKHIAGLVIFFLKPLLECLHQRLITCFVALHYLANGFVHYYYMIIFVNYFHFLLLIAIFHKITTFRVHIQIF